MVSLQSALVCLALAGTSQTELLDFSATWCGPCRQMEPVVHSLASQGYPIRKIDVDQDRATTAKFGVTGYPCFIMLVDGREVDREMGATSRERLLEMLSRAPAKKPAATAVLASTSQTADASRPSFAREQAQRTSGANNRLPAQVSQQPLAPQPIMGQPQQQRQLAEAAVALAVQGQATQRCLASSVRLRVEDAAGNSIGSGTIVDSRQGEALILTCGHIFRDSKGTGKIHVDLFGPGAPKGLTAELVGYDLDRDVGLVSIRPGVQVVAARLAPPDYKLRSGDNVINVGCDNGREPTAHVSHVTSTDKYVAPPNIQVAGQPVEGRSGGGLFTQDGMVVGVCFAADPTDNEGLYAAISSIHSELARLGIDRVISTEGRPEQYASVAPPTMPPAMPRVASANEPSRAVPTTANDPRVAPTASAPRPAGLSASEQALLDKLRAAGEDAEVICIVRPLRNPNAKSEILVLDRPSNEFVRQLSAIRREPHHLTSYETQPHEARRTAPVLDSRRLPTTVLR